MTDIISISKTRINFPPEQGSTYIILEIDHPGWNFSNTGTNWCKVTKRDETHLLVTVNANTTSKSRKTSFLIISNDDMDDTEEIIVAQSASFDAETLILPNKQKDPIGCAVACAAMCVCQTQEQLVKDGFPLNDAWWDLIATKYGYNYMVYEIPSLKLVYDTLKDGYPIIVQVNVGIKEHWVTVYQYTGSSTNGQNLNVSDFMCIDPNTGKPCKFNQSVNFNANSPVNRTVVYKQKLDS